MRLCCSQTPRRQVSRVEAHMVYCRCQILIEWSMSRLLFYITARQVMTVIWKMHFSIHVLRIWRCEMMHCKVRKPPQELNNFCVIITAELRGGNLASKMYLSPLMASPVKMVVLLLLIHCLLLLPLFVCVCVCVWGGGVFGSLFCNAVLSVLSSFATIPLWKRKLVAWLDHTHYF